MSLQEKFRGAAAKRGFFIARIVEKNDVTQLLGSLWPVETRFPLIRLGGPCDGGYLIPDDLAGITACFSPGVANIAQFEQDLVDRGIPCFLADASVDAAPIAGPLVCFDKKFLDVWNSNDLVTLDTWVEQYAPLESDLLLQMDIEGAEWRVLLNASDKVLRRFRIIVVELHNMEKIAIDSMNSIVSSVLKRLLRDFYVVHAHPNNWVEPVLVRGIRIPRVIEITLLRKDRCPVIGPVRTLPHPLDRKNRPARPDVALPAELFPGAFP